MSAVSERRSERSRKGPAARPPEDRFRLRCPECGASAFTAGSDLLCPSEGRRIEGRSGVVPLLSTERSRALSPFLAHYRAVRRAEGWGGGGDYYLGLPFHDASGRHRRIWRLRARSFRTAVRLIESHFPDAKRADELGRRALRILDLGAGNGWLAWRLAGRGHDVLAVDVSLDDEDGLLAMDRYARGAVAFEARIVRAVADMESLPLDDAQFDVVVANASLHYATSLESSLAEAHRLLDERGLLLALDSPTFDDAGSGREMVRRRQREHRERHGAEASDGARGVGFLLSDELGALLEARGFDVRTKTPFEGIERALRRAYGRWRGRPVPARFPVVAAVKR